MKFTALKSRISYIVYRILGVAFCFILLSLITHHSSLITRDALAEGEFETNYNVTYSVDQNGKTNVTQQIELKNKTPNFYAERFELKIGSTKVADVTAQDNTGPLETEVKFENEVTLITIKFNQKVIGTGKSLSWNLNYASGELASKSGQIWEVSIPRLAKSADINEYKAKVIIPRNFGPVAFATPEPKEQAQVGQNQEFSFERDQLYESGIAMSFGQNQVFSFKLDYYLENNNVTSQYDYITLPPDNNYQRIVLEKIEPPPLDVLVDEDGNFLGQYKISPKKALNVTATGYVEVFSKPFRNIYPVLSNEKKELYTQPQRYWERDSGEIKDKAAELKTPKAIYDFVATYLKYSDQRLNSEKIERKGASAAFAKPEDSVCMEFTDLFIAIARAAGIPAREVEGYAYTQNERLRPLSLIVNGGDILHAWPEYWDDKLGWVQVDPTWGSTSGGLDYFEKLDFNHITFVSRGKSSTSPPPAGAYKKASEPNKKTVSVEFAKSLPQPTTNPQISLVSPNKIISGIPTKILGKIKNGGSTTIFSQKAQISSSHLGFSSPREYEIPILPPFAQRTYEYRTRSPNIFTQGSDTLVLSYADTQVSKPVTIEPLYKIIFSPIVLASSLLIPLFIAGGLILYKKLHKKPLNLKSPL